jgi:N-formylglutamate amidohydrolase
MNTKNIDFRIDYSKLKIFEEFNTKDLKFPIVLSSPHAGTFFPKEFIENSSLTEHELRISEDCHVTDLVKKASALGIPLLSLNLPRTFVDVNRDKIEIDDTMFFNPPQNNDVNSRRCRVGLGVLHRVVYQNKNIYNGLLNYEEALDRIKHVYEPYHKRLKQLVDKCVRKFGYCLLIDCHSMPSMICNIMNESKSLDFCICNLFDESCPIEVSQKMHQLLENKQYRVEFNRPYAGAYITFNYCQPRKNIYTMQLEINRSLYMDEQSYQKNQRFQSVADHLSSSIEALGYFLLDFKK